jgi:hypothetical protein
MDEAEARLTSSTKVLMTKGFARFARRAGVVARSLVKAAAAVAAGEFDADLGGHVFKQRIARPGQGKSGGFRTIVVFRLGGHSFFVHGFAKNEKANVTREELKSLKRLASVYLDFSEEEIAVAIADGALIEVKDDDDEEENQPN